MLASKEYPRSTTIRRNGASTTVSSEPVPFVTRLSEEQYTSVHPMWSSNASAQFVLFRREVSITPPYAHAHTDDATTLFLAVSAKPQPDEMLPHGRNTSHLLCAYKLWFNGVPLGVGPGRIVNDRIAVDTFNVTALTQSTAGSSRQVRLLLLVSGTICYWYSVHYKTARFCIFDPFMCRNKEDFF